MLWFWLAAGPALLLAIGSLLLYRSGRPPAIPPGAQLPPATVIVPVKGHDEGLRENLAALAALDYPDFELIVAAQEASDIPPGVLPGNVRIVLAHGGEAGASEKVQNLAAAARMCRIPSEILAFADSDGRVPRGWLRALALELARPGVGAATGYRWYAPECAGFWSMVRVVWNAAIAGTLRPCGNSFAWGGAMAIRKETFFSAGVPEYWSDAVSDDYALSDAVHAAGLTIAFTPGAMVAVVDGICARDFFGWARRQLMLSRVHRPRLYWTALAAHAIYCSGMAACAVALVHGYRWAALVLAVQIGCGVLKGARPAALARRALPGFRHRPWIEAALNPLVTWVWLATLVAGAFGVVIEWRGRRYRLVRRSPAS